MDYRHGDLFYKKIDNFKGESVFKGNKFVLAEGEVTGHCHTLEGEFEILEDMDKGIRAIKVLKPSVITHQEHKTIELQPATYIEIREKEYNYFDKEIQRVVD